ncbi:hypothetical protein QUC31_009156, partial [Theobroma cacao]
WPSSCPHKSKIEEIPSMQMKYQPRKQKNHSSPVCRGRENQSWGNHYVKYETSLSTSRKTEKTLNVSNGESFIQVRFLGRPVSPCFSFPFSFISLFDDEYD